MHPALAPRKERIAVAAVEKGLVGSGPPLAAFIDVAAVRESAGDLLRSFPSFFEHVFAVKANPAPSMLALLRDCGLGCEAASHGELMEALAAGVPADRIVLDGPAKTWGELELALQLGVSLNIDNFQELARVDQLIAGRTPAGQIGIRINPQVGPGSITGMSTATASSKFGVPLDDPGNRAALIAAYQARPWLTAIHTHVGSQGVPMDLAAGGIARALDLVSDINRTSGTQQITTVNIGGGLSVNFQDDEVRPTFAGYARALAAKVPDLFTGRYKVVTEFGRSLLAKHGFMISRVEYTKAVGGSRIAITHAGAQVAVRTVFRPDEWPIRISALTPRGTAKTGTLVPQDIAGPCCFAGDLLAKGRLLPLLEQNDLILAHDTGAYYFSNPFSYNSLPAPPAYLVSDGSSLDFEEIRRTTLPQVAAS